MTKSASRAPTLRQPPADMAREATHIVLDLCRYGTPLNTP